MLLPALHTHNPQTPPYHYLTKTQHASTLPNTSTTYTIIPTTNTLYQASNTT